SATDDPAARTASQWANAVPWLKDKTQTAATTPTQSAAPKPKKQPTAPPETSSQSWELFIGRKLIGWIGTALLILAAVLLVMHGMREGWITNQLIVTLIAAFGTALLGVGYYCRRVGLRRFSTMISCAGIVILYLDAYASYAVFKLVDFSTGSLLMPLVVLGGFLLAWLYRSKLLGTVVIIGGLAVPLLISSGVDEYQKLFVYLVSLNIGTLVLVNLLRRAPIAWIAFFGTQALFWMWHTEFLSGSFYPEEYPVQKLVAALIFQSAFYLVFLSDTVITALKPISKRLRPTWDDAMRAILAPIIFFGSIYVMAHRGGTYDKPGGLTLLGYDPLQVFLIEWLGILAFIGAAWYAILAVLYSRHLARIWNAEVEKSLSQYWKSAPSAAMVISLGFVAIGIPLQFYAMWITLGWLTIFAGLWYFGHRQKDKIFVVMSLVFFILGMPRLMWEMIDQLTDVRNTLDLMPVFNTVALPMLACVTVLIVAAVLAHRFIPKDVSHDKYSATWGFNNIVGILGYILLGVILSGEAARYIYATPELWSPYTSDYLLSAFLLGFWFSLVVVLLQIGFVCRNQVIATVACCGLALTVMAMFYGFQHRCTYQEAFNNPYSIILIAQSIILLLIGYQSKFVPRRFEEPHYPGIFGSFGIVGLFSLLAILTIEWYNHWLPLAEQVTTFRSVTVFWSVYAFVWITFGFAARSLPIRICGMIILFGALLKTTFLDSHASFGYASWEWQAEYSLEVWTLLINPYFMTMLFPVVPALALAVWTHQSRILATFVGEQERIAWKASGIIGIVALFIYSSVECHRYFEAIEPRLFDIEQVRHTFLASTSLTVFWTIAALVLTTLALCYNYKALRIIAMALLVLTALKIFADLEMRPAFAVPFLNPYFLPMFIFAGVLIALGYLWVRKLSEADAGERNVYYVLALGGIIFLWFTMSVECFRSFGVIEAKYWTMKHPFLASAALTIFWTTLAVVLAIVAFSSRSTALRIVSMSLLGITALKILFDLDVRPEFSTPFLNLYFMPMFVFAMVLIAIAYLWVRQLDEHSTERQVYRVVAFTGVVFLWFTLSMECYRSVQYLLSLQEEHQQAAWQAQMA
ncbi:MAG: DUF2339 domain-containing protein, partial [Planctomycetaceae bacterium]|nr:DUF2339 domain-containing protein [Planctomycetaceae bacterium]